MKPKWSSLLLLCFCCGCSSGPFTVGAGFDQPVGGGTAVDLRDGFSDRHDATDLGFRYREQPPAYFKVWIERQFGTPRERVSSGSAPSSIQLSNPAADPPGGPSEKQSIEVLGMRIPTDAPWELILAIAVLVGAIGLFGVQRGKRYLDKRKEAKDG